MMKEKIRKEAEKLNIDCFGTTSHNGKSIAVFLFPYYFEYNKGNISRYAVGMDYHKVCKKYLTEIAENSGLSDYEIFADVSPYNERELAKNAGLGIIGENGLLINEKYGSYVFIGLIVLNSIKLEDDKLINKECLKCYKCKKLCPAKESDKCLSDISQKRGELSEEEKALIIKNGMIWGCDVCSEVCPMNDNITETPIPEFKENIIASLKLSDIDNLSNKEFLQKFYDRAFTWRGKNVLLRNCRLLETD